MTWFTLLRNDFNLKFVRMEQKLRDITEEKITILKTVKQEDTGYVKFKNSATSAVNC